MTKIWITEEYGYREWIWEYPGTQEELIADWAAGKAPLNFFNPSSGAGELYKGTMTQFDICELMDVDGFKLLLLGGDSTQEVMERIGAVGRAHVHEEEDTWLSINGEDYTPSGTIPREIPEG
jgi:hypothetical protein